MANTVKVRRSATPSAIPTVGQLALGEIAVNTYDGKMFIKKDVSGAQTIVEVTAASNGTAGGVTSVTGTAPVVSSGGTTPAISMAAATTSVSGYLTSTDWNTFNGKQAAGSYVTVGGALGTPSSGTLTNCTFPTLNQNTTGSSGSCTGNAATATSSSIAGGVVWENSLTISANYTMSSGKSGKSAGPITVNSGITVTIPSGSKWVIL